jgi:Rv2525c-like, glycoside hydrolase-like domain
MRRVALCVLALVAVLPAGAEAKTVHFGGRVVDVPDGWPVIRLAERPQACVRLDRKAVYLGTPGSAQRCPADAIGRRRAILIDPGARARAARARGQASRVPPARISAASEYTGLGFDACTAPSRRSMAAWGDSPYRAIGVYIGGENRGCSQPNLTASWVAEQTAAGWSLIPTYVGLQAPTSSCTSCATLSSSTATAARQGSEAADDAVSDAQLAGIGEGSPIYFDMESYSRTSSASNATLTFLAAWTTRLHALGYVSGVYSSSASGIADLASRLGTSYQQPDDIWIANWNGRANAADSYVPASAWADHQRIHQYRGGHDETYGGVTINIDNNYVEGATVGALPVAAESSLPPLSVLRVRSDGGVVSVRVRCGWPDGEVCPGQIILRSHLRVGAGLRRSESAARIVRVAVARRTFRLAGGRIHTFRVALDESRRPLLRRRGGLRVELLVAIPGSRKLRRLRL